MAPGAGGGDGGGDGWLAFLLTVAGVIAGTYFINKLLHPEFPCPNCGHAVPQNAPCCGKCMIPLQWTVGQGQNQNVG